MTVQAIVSSLNPVADPCPILRRLYGPRPRVPAPARTGRLNLPDGAGLSWWDTGGKGPAVILAHPHSGDADSFALQRGALAGAGFRAIAYSRRGYGDSSRGRPQAPGTQGGDLAALVAHLVSDRPVHLVGVAAGGAAVLDFALGAGVGRVASLLISSSLMSIRDPNWVALLRTAQGAAMHSLPIAAREVSGGFRAAFPAEAAAWEAVAEANHARASGEPPQPLAQTATLARLAALTCPVLLVTGAADLYLPPPLLEVAGRAVPLARRAVIAHAGHCPQFERPAAFNRLLLTHLARAQS